MNIYSRGFTLLVIIVGFVLTVYLVKVEQVFTSWPDSILTSKQFDGERFKNSETEPSMALSRILAKYWNDPQLENVPEQPVPVTVLTRDDITALPDDKLSVIRFGHSTTLIKIAGQVWLIDPVFSERISPFSFMGPKRFHPSPISLDEMPRLNGVLISHNHYDHLDRTAIQGLAASTQHFIVPLGLADKLARWGVEREKITELDWWQSIQLNGLELVATPAQHFSGRGIFDRNLTLWNSWVIKSAGQRVFYSGDSGYFNGFKTIGDRYGPFDLTLMEVGAYDPLWPSVHMFPAEAIKAHADLRGARLLPVHNGTFDLAFHSWYAPLEEISMLGQDANVDILTPIMGEVVTLPTGVSERTQSNPWWQELR